MTMWTRMAPESLQVILESYAELVNTPRIGTYNNYMWSSTQFNVSEPQRVGEGKFVGWYTPHYSYILFRAVAWCDERSIRRLSHRRR